MLTFLSPTTNNIVFKDRELEELREEVNPKKIIDTCSVNVKVNVLNVLRVY